MRKPLGDSPFYLNMIGVMDDGMRKNYITNNICIGDKDSSYMNFDVVVNMNYPYNRIPHGKIGRREESVHKNNCTLYLVGLCDHDSENINDYIDIIIPKLQKRYEENNDTKFLFHCFAGKSRSVAITLAFMIKVMRISFDDALSLIKEERPIIIPRPLFIENIRDKNYDSLSGNI